MDNGDNQNIKENYQGSDWQHAGGKLVEYGAGSKAVIGNMREVNLWNMAPEVFLMLSCFRF
jgi:hypothetical protein